jgi:hypothetical protein
MGPSDMEELLAQEPFVPFRMTLTTGDRILVPDRQSINTSFLSVSVSDRTITGRPRLRIISMPNIDMIEPVIGPDPGVDRLRGDE